MEYFSRLIAIVLFILLIPLFLLVSIISLISQGGPIIYKQTRIGFNFSPFTIYKFRSLHKSSEGINSFSTGKAYTATRWGSFIRKSKIDELPQLFNIIKGDMVFIGPRPELPEFVNYLSFKYLDIIKPGLSCYSSILFRDESYKFNFFNKENSYEEILEIKTYLDNFYRNKKSFFIDFKLVLFTIISIFFPKTMTKYFSNYISNLVSNNDMKIQSNIFNTEKFVHESKIYG